MQILKKDFIEDTDLRRPVVHKIMNIDKEPGITNYLAGNIDSFGEIVKPTDIKNLYAVTSGIIPPNPLNYRFKKNETNQKPRERMGHDTI